MKTGMERMRQLATLSVRKGKWSKKDEEAISRSFISLCDEVYAFREQQGLDIIPKTIDKKSKV